MHISCRIRGTGKIFGSYMRTRDMEDAKDLTTMRMEVIGLHVNMGNAETESNGHRRQGGAKWSWLRL
jgi:hypothetical protein